MSPAPLVEHSVLVLSVARSGILMCPAAHPLCGFQALKFLLRHIPFPQEPLIDLESLSSLGGLRQVVCVCVCVCVLVGRAVLVLVSRPLLQVCSQDIFWPTGSLGTLILRTFAPWQTGHWSLSSPKLLYLYKKSFRTVYCVYNCKYCISCNTIYCFM